ncbi:10735_t:CDS:1 [Racocetra fulgida]|uniref:10735_t:CDS:1 n=1 Tax=Racocetra fulgida TaxID=60492 RepID=A0A9N9F480_9GLOM|nr:10735_t:CDS:1 [Racocetra fulgida]
MCYYSVYARHLMNVIATVKKHSVIYVNGELIITDDSNLVHIRNISFSEYQSSLVTARDTIQLSWETKNNDEENKLNTVAQTIATKVKGNNRRKKITPTTTPYFRTKPRSIRFKVTDLANNFLNEKSTTSEQTTSSTTNSK